MVFGFIGPPPPRVPSILLFIGVDLSAPIGEWTHPLMSPPLESFPFRQQMSLSLSWDTVSDNVPNCYTCNTVPVDDPKMVLQQINQGLVTGFRGPN